MVSSGNESYPVAGSGGWDPPSGPGRLTVDSGTDTDTTSDDGVDEVDFSDIAGMTPEEADARIYWQYAQAKQRWRRHTQKLARRVWRFTI